MKKKNFLMLVAAAAVLSAVICAAGCISADEDEGAAVLGTWYHGDDSFEAVFTLAENHTGVYCLIKDDAGKTGAEGPFPRIDFLLWNMDGDKLSMVCEDGRTITGFIDETDGSLMTDRLGIGYELIDLAAGDADAAYIWYYEDDATADISIDWADGTGIDYRLEAVVDKDGKFTGEITGSTETYTWELDEEGNDLTIYSDGTVEHNIYGDNSKSLTTDYGDDTLYLLMPGVPAAFASMLAWAADQKEDNAAVLGTWYHADDSIEDMFILADDNTGVFFTIKDDEGKLGLTGDLPQVYPFIWDVNDNKLFVVFKSGYAFTAAFDEKTGSLTSDNLGIRYEPVDLAAGDADVEYVWYYETDAVADISIDLADGTGIDYRLKAVVDKDGKFTGELAGSTMTYTWELDADGNDVTIYSDGTVEHNIYGDDSKTLATDTNGDGTYELMPGVPAAFACMLAWAADKLA